MAIAADAQSVETTDEFGKNPEGVARRWKTEIDLAKKDRQKWMKQVKDIVKRYRDERAEKDDACRFNILWSNVQTLGPAIYAKPPQPIVERRFLDRDPIGRKACRILERTLIYQLEVSYFHRSIKLARDDYLLTAQGVAWIRYEPTYKMDEAKLSDVRQTEGEEAQAYPTVADEKTCVDYVHWSDYLTSPARVEDEVTWKARRSFLTRAQIKKRFDKLSPEALKKIPLDHSPAGMSKDDADKPENELLLKATVWEIWDKTEKKVIFLAEQFTDQPLEVVDDPLSLEGFWPTPCPILGTVTNDSVIPVPDYHLYKDQAQELDDLTTRISLLTDAIRAAGVYDSSWPVLERLIEEGGENKLYPCDQWAAFAEKGGIPGAVSFLPIKEMAEVLIRLYEARQQVKNDLYEITGISDIVRGFSSGAAKTATEQRIKGQFANLRLTDRQNEMARFTRDTLAIMAEIIAEHFSPETIYLMSGYEQWGIEDHLPPEMPGMGHNGGPPMEGAPQQQPAPGGAPQGPAQPQPIQIPPEIQKQMLMEQAKAKAMEEFSQAIALLKDEKLRGFRIDVETDSTIEPDQQMEKQARVEFLTASSQFMEKALQAGMIEPELIPLLGKMLLFGVRGFRAGRELETAFEETITKMEEKAKQPKQPQPSPEEIKAKTEQQKLQMEMQMRQQEMQFEMAQKQEEAKRDAELKAMEMEFKRQEHQMKMEELVRKSQIDLMKYNLELEKMQAGVALDQQKAQIQAQSMEQKAAFEERAAIRQDQFDERSMERQAEHDEASMERQADADERKAAIAEKAMKQKAAMAGKSAEK